MYSYYYSNSNSNSSPRLRRVETHVLLRRLGRRHRALYIYIYIYIYTDALMCLVIKLYVLHICEINMFRFWNNMCWAEHVQSSYIQMYNGRTLSFLWRNFIGIVPYTIKQAWQQKSGFGACIDSRITPVIHVRMTIR